MSVCIKLVDITSTGMSLICEIVVGDFVYRKLEDFTERGTFHIGNEEFLDAEYVPEDDLHAVTAVLEGCISDINSRGVTHAVSDAVLVGLGGLHEMADIVDDLPDRKLFILIDKLN